MKKILTFTLICLCSVLLANAQSAEQARILLSSYSYTEADNLVGTLHVHGTSDDPTGQFVIKGENAEIFKISGNKLFIRKKYSKSEEKWYDITVEAETGGGQLSADFRILKDQFFNNGVIAHRGAWKNTGAPQNSIASLREAVKLGCEGSEFDVHMTSDEVTILFHDRDMQGAKIEENTFERLSKLKLSNGKSAPTLLAFLEAGMEQNTTKLILEIKASAISKERSLELTEKVVNQVRELRAQAWIDYICFDYDVLKKVLELDPYAKVAYLNGDKAPAEVAGDQFYGLDYNHKVFKKNPSWIKEAKENNLTLNVWTVNEPELMDWFLERELDFITTDEPEILLEKVKGK